MNSIAQMCKTSDVVKSPRVCRLAKDCEPVSQGSEAKGCGLTGAKPPRVTDQGLWTCETATDLQFWPPEDIIPLQGPLPYQGILYSSYIGVYGLTHVWVKFWSTRTHTLTHLHTPAHISSACPWYLPVGSNFSSDLPSEIDAFCQTVCVTSTRTVIL